MKSEERHELQQNDLENWMIGAWVWFKKYGSYVLLALALALLAYQGWVLLEGRKSQKIQQAWQELSEAASGGISDPPAMFRKIIEENPGQREIVALAYAKMGQFYLHTVDLGNPPGGVQDVRVTREQALQEAETAFKKVVSDYADETLALATARLGLAVVAEDRGDWAGAREQYAKITEKNSPLAGSVYAKQAEAKLKELSNLEKPVIFGAASAAPKMPGLGEFGPFGPTMGPASAPASTPASGPASGPSSGPASGPAATRKK